jgi:hypothetical protein
MAPAGIGRFADHGFQAGLLELLSNIISGQFFAASADAATLEEITGEIFHIGFNSVDGKGASFGGFLCWEIAGGSEQAP